MAKTLNLTLLGEGQGGNRSALRSLCDQTSHDERFVDSAAAAGPVARPEISVYQEIRPRIQAPRITGGCGIYNTKAEQVDKSSTTHNGRLVFTRLLGARCCCCEYSQSVRHNIMDNSTLYEL